MSGDNIKNLPVSSASTISNQDAVLVGHLFGSQDTVNRDALTNHFKGPFLAAALTGVALLPAFDDLLAKFAPSTKDNLYMRIIIKMLVVAVMYWILSNWVLIRK